MSAITATIKSNNQVMDPAYELLSIDIVKEVNRIPYAVLTLLDGSAAQQKFAISDGAFFEPGKAIEIKLRYEGDASNETSIFKGLVVKQVVEANRQGTRLTVEMKDAAIQLSQFRRSKVYRNKTDERIIGELIGEAGLKRGRLATTQPEHPEIVQYYCTDWDFMLTRAEANGLLVIANDGEIALNEITLNGLIKHTFEFGISEIYDFEIEVDASHQRASVESIAWDIKNQKLTQASKAKAFNLTQGNLKADTLANAVGGKLETLSSAIPLDLKTLQAWADGAMIKSRMAMIRGRISVPGFGDIGCLDAMEVEGIGKRFNGKTLVTGIRHRVDQNGWQTDVQFGLSPERFTTRRDIVDVSAAGLLPGVNGLQIGIVDKFEDDPDKEYRVKVILPGINERQGAVWARLATPDAGKERGYFFRPETGDEVVVGFFNDDPRQAVILGAMFGSKNTPHKNVATLTEKNVHKAIITKKGTTIGFVDDDKSAVFIETPNKNKLLFDDSEQMVKLSDQHGNTITMNKDGIEIKSAKDLKIEAAANVEIKGSMVDVK